MKWLLLLALMLGGCTVQGDFVLVKLVWRDSIGTLPAASQPAEGPWQNGK
jgi:hypothetical protein